MSIDPIQIILQQLDRIERSQERMNQKLDDKVDFRTFDDFRERMEERVEHVDKQVEQLTQAAVSPDQVNSLIGNKLQESQARGITARDRWIRWTVAAMTILTAGLLLYEKINP